MNKSTTWTPVHRFTLVLVCLVPRLTSTERLVAAVTARGKVVVVAVGAVDLFILGGERLVDQRQLAGAALEAELMPVPLFVRQVLVIEGRKHEIKYT